MTAHLSLTEGPSKGYQRWPKIVAAPLTIPRGPNMAPGTWDDLLATSGRSVFRSAKGPGRLSAGKENGRDFFNPLLSKRMSVIVWLSF